MGQGFIKFNRTEQLFKNILDISSGVYTKLIYACDVFEFRVDVT